MSKTTVILSGPMSNLLNDNKPMFNCAAAELRELGYNVVNPAEIQFPAGATWGEMTGACLETMRLIKEDQGDEKVIVACLQGHNKSTGSYLECVLAANYEWERKDVVDLLWVKKPKQKEKRNEQRNRSPHWPDERPAV